jgi:hypothetical protein
MSPNRAKRCTQLEQTESKLKDLEKQSYIVQNAHERELALLFTESTAQNATLEHEIAILKIENQRLNTELSVLPVYQEQNKMLQLTIETMRETTTATIAAEKKEKQELSESVINKKASLRRQYNLYLQHYVHSSGFETASNGGIAGLGGASANVSEDEIKMDKLIEKIAKLKGQCASLQVENDVYKDTRKQHERNTAHSQHLRACVSHLEQEVKDKNFQIQGLLSIIEAQAEKQKVIEDLQVRCNLLASREAESNGLATGYKRRAHQLEMMMLYRRASCTDAQDKVCAALLRFPRTRCGAARGGSGRGVDGSLAFEEKREDEKCVLSPLFPSRSTEHIIDAQDVKSCTVGGFYSHTRPETYTSFSFY